MARPTVRPTRCPAPRRASELDAPMPVAPAPRRTKPATSAANSLAATAAAKRAEATDPATTAKRPALPSAAPSREPEPTFSTSAAATPSG